MLLSSPHPKSIWVEEVGGPGRVEGGGLANLILSNITNDQKIVWNWNIIKSKGTFLTQTPSRTNHRKNN